MVDNITSARAIGFLVWFYKYYGSQCSDTLKNIAINYKQCNYVTIRTYIIELEQRGYIIVENRGKKDHLFVVNEAKYLKMVS